MSCLCICYNIQDRPMCSQFICSCIAILSRIDLFAHILCISHIISQDRIIRSYSHMFMHLTCNFQKYVIFTCSHIHASHMSSRSSFTCFSLFSKLPHTRVTFQMVKVMNEIKTRYHLTIRVVVFLTHSAHIIELLNPQLWFQIFDLLFSLGTLEVTFR